MEIRIEQKAAALENPRRFAHPQFQIGRMAYGEPRDDRIEQAVGKR
jgi:hypothetical protein